MNSEMLSNKDYAAWLEGVKSKVRAVQIKAAIKVNAELLNFYWELGADIVAKQTQAKWGEGFLAQLSKDLMSEFPEVKGFSLRNLKYVKQWYLFYNQDNTIGQQAVAQITKQAFSQPPNQKSQQPVGRITQIPWGHNLTIIAKCKNKDKLVAEYALSDIHKPIGVSEYQLTHSLPSDLKSSLPTVEEIEAELGGDWV